MILQILQITISVILAAFFAIGSFFNLKVVWRYCKKQPGPSIIPILPGVAGSIALYIFPSYPLFPYFWIALFVDIGCIPYLFVFSLVVFKESWITNSKLHLALAGTNLEGEKIELTLYRNYTFVAKKKIPPSTIISTEGKWKFDKEDLILHWNNSIVKFKPTKHKQQKFSKIHCIYEWVSSSKDTLFDNSTLCAFSSSDSSAE